MSGKAQFGIAPALIVAVVAAPALACLVYIAQHAYTHNCCAGEKPQSAVLARCCAYSPAITARNIDVPAPMIAATPLMASDAVEPTPNLVSIVIPNFDTSPPGCNSILRI